MPPIICFDLQSCKNFFPFHLQFHGVKQSLNIIEFISTKKIWKIGQLSISSHYLPVWTKPLVNHVWPRILLLMWVGWLFMYYNVCTGIIHLISIWVEKLMIKQKLTPWNDFLTSFFEVYWIYYPSFKKRIKETITEINIKLKFRNKQSNIFEFGLEIFQRCKDSQQFTIDE